MPSVASGPAPQGTAQSETDREVHWRRNVLAVCAGQAAAIFGLSFSRPFLPIFLGSDLGLHNAQQLAFWTGVSSGVLGVGLGVAGPAWGWVADRIGRKSMLVRAMIGGSVTVALMALCTTPLEYTVLWFMFGALSGTTPVAIALTASETPREHVGWALGMVTAANSLGQSLGPAMAGLAASAIGLRWTYVLGAAIEAAAIVPVILMVKERSFRRRDQVGAKTGVSARGGVGRRILVAVVVLLCAQALFVTSTQSMQPLVVLRLYRISPVEATFLAGIAFAGYGAASALAAATYSRVAKRMGLRPIGVVAISAFTVAVAVAALSDSRTILIAAVAVAGLSAGVVGPVLSTLLGLEAPIAIQATAFGFIGTANAFGLSVGPLLGGGIAAAYSPTVGLLTSAAVALLLGVLMVVAIREPSGPSDPKPSSRLMTAFTGGSA